MSITLEVLPKTAAVLEPVNTGAGDKAFVFTQGTPSNEWVIQHTLNKYPSVTVADSAGSVVIGDIQFISKSEIRLFFEHPFSGKAFLN